MSSKRIARISKLRLPGTGDRPRLDVDRLDLFEGEVLGLLGGNGAGKSTLLRALALLEPGTAGSIEIFGQTAGPGNALALRRRCAVVFQAPLLFDRSIRKNVALGLEFRRLPHEEIRRRVDHWLDRLSIRHLADRPAREVSGGEAQRASLARALVLEPELLLLDEPFANLDAPSRGALLDDLQGLFAERRSTVLFVTHDREELLRLADRAAVLVDGALVQLAEVEELFNRPATPEVAELVGVETIVRGTSTGPEGGLTRISVDGVELLGTEAVEAGPVLVCIRPESVILAHPAAEMETGTSALNRLHGTVRAVHPMGVVQRVDLDCGFDLRVAVTPRSVESLKLVPGSKVVALVKASAIHAIPRRVEEARG